MQNCSRGIENYCFKHKKTSSAAGGFTVVKVVLWSRGAHLTKPGWSKHHTHSNPTNLALFRHKITLYRFNQGGSYYYRGVQMGAGGLSPLTLTTGALPHDPQRGLCPLQDPRWGSAPDPHYRLALPHSPWVCVWPHFSVPSADPALDPPAITTVQQHPVITLQHMLIGKRTRHNLSINHISSATKNVIHRRI